MFTAVLDASLNILAFAMGVQNATIIFKLQN